MSRLRLVRHLLLVFARKLDGMHYFYLMGHLKEELEQYQLNMKELVLKRMTARGPPRANDGESYSTSSTGRRYGRVRRSKLLTSVKLSARREGQSNVVVSS
mmetsp:Transcript_27581/g.55686  ORF Transcript_27581/g.55686 Transcript_27581/m.55686 type:complete len:101 (-) Transcript_27581:87-389(-)